MRQCSRPQYYVISFYHDLRPSIKEGLEMKHLDRSGLSSTGILRHNFWGDLEEVPQEDIDHWCQQCQFPYGEEKCREKDLIQRCWFELQAIAKTLNLSLEAHVWHLQHECPFIRKGEACRCNAFGTMEEAFQAAGLEYKKAME